MIFLSESEILLRSAKRLFNFVQSREASNSPAHPRACRYERAERVRDVE